MVNIKKLKKVFNSKLFLIGFFSIFLGISILFFGYKVYLYLEKKDNEEVFFKIYDVLDKYQPALESNSQIPIEEIYAEIEGIKKSVGFFSSFKNNIDIISNITFLLNEKNMKAKNASNEIYFNSASPFDFLNNLFCAIHLAMQEDINQKQKGILLLKNLSKSQKYFRDVALFYYGYFILRTTSLRQADEAWYPLLNDPVFNSSSYKKLVVKARNWDY